MKSSWFKKIGWIYIPTTVQGVVIAILFIAFCIHIFLFVDNRAHSVSDTFYGVFPFVIPAFLFYIWIASEKSKQ
jgi:hypothetical protein